MMMGTIVDGLLSDIAVASSAHRALRSHPYSNVSVAELGTQLGCRLAPRRLDAGGPWTDPYASLHWRTLISTSFRRWLADAGKLACTLGGIERSDLNDDGIQSVLSILHDRLAPIMQDEQASVATLLADARRARRDVAAEYVGRWRAREHWTREAIDTLGHVSRVGSVHLCDDEAESAWEALIESKRSTIAALLRRQPAYLRVECRALGVPLAELAVHLDSTAVHMTQSGVTCASSIRFWFCIFGAKAQTACALALARRQRDGVAPDDDPRWHGVRLRRRPEDDHDGWGICCPDADHVSGVDSICVALAPNAVHAGGDGGGVAAMLPSVRIAELVVRVVELDGFAPSRVRATLLMAPMTRMQSVARNELERLGYVASPALLSNDSTRASENTDSTHAGDAAGGVTVDVARDGETAETATWKDVSGVVPELQEAFVLTVAIVNITEKAALAWMSTSAAVNISITHIVDALHALPATTDVVRLYLRRRTRASLEQSISHVVRRLLQLTAADTMPAYGRLPSCAGHNTGGRSIYGTSATMRAFADHARIIADQMRIPGPTFARSVWFSSRQAVYKARKRTRAAVSSGDVE